MKRGIYCLEIGEWFGSAKQTHSVEPILQLLNRCKKNPYIHRDIATHEELVYYLQHWTQKRFSSHPILYLAFHGTPGCLLLRRPSGREKSLPLDQVLEPLLGACKGRFIHFGACSAVDVHGRTLNRYLRETHAIGLSGFNADVDWLDSTLFELALLDSLVSTAFRRDSLRRMQRSLRTKYLPLWNDLGARIIIRK